MKPFRIVSSSDITSSLSNKSDTPLEWSKCIFCQEDTGKKLVCPADYADRFRGAGYKTIAETLQAFYDLGCLPDDVNLTRMNDGDGLEQTFVSRRAKFHTTCSLKFNKNELQRATKRKTSADEEISPGAKKKYTRQNLFRKDEAADICFFCDEPATDSKPLHKASTLDLDTRVRQCAVNVQDQRLIAKLSERDLIAKGAEYHTQCLVSLYNRDRDRAGTSHDQDDTNTAKSTAFAELISYIQDALKDKDTTPVFQLSELKKLYVDRVDQLGGDPSVVHSTRLKEKILSYIPQLEAYNEGRNVLFVASENVGKSLRRSCQLGDESEAVLLSRAANIIRQDMLRKKCEPFSGSFTEDCQENSVPQSLLMLISMILYGTSIKDNASYLSQPALSLSQLITYNSCVRRRQQPSSNTRHFEQRETPLPLFLGALVHTKTRSKDLVDTLYKLGLSVSYDRVLGLSADLGNSAISHFETVGTVCPPTLNIGVFTTSAVDNIDHDPTATSAHGSFHGTGISLFQHPDTENRGTEQTRVSISRSGKKISKLPDSYTLVPAASVAKDEPPVPEVCGLKQPSCSLMNNAVAEENDWCDHLSKIIDEGNYDSTSGKDLHISWAAYHSRRQQLEETPILGPAAVSALLPLFPNDSKSVAMIRHSMNVVKKAVAVLNPGQIPVITFDQPLFKIAKQIQWMWPEEYGEESFVVMLGGLHIKMTLLKALGDFLDGSGWTSALVQAEIATAGTSNSFLKVAHVKRTARAHQITACALYKLRQASYVEWQTNQLGCSSESFEEWCEQRALQSPQFHFWQLVLSIELEVLTWDRSIHEGNFLLYVEALTRLQWLFHSLDHYNYARASAIHLRDMVILREKHPRIFEAFCKGKFTVNKTQRAFSRMAIDESHEQNNACVKGDGGAVGLTENPSALLRWMVSGPEMARIIGEFRTVLDKKETVSQLHHHEDQPGDLI